MNKAITFEEYSEGVSRCKSLSQLLSFLYDNKLLAHEAFEEARWMDEEDFEFFREGVLHKRKIGVDFPDSFGVILCPPLMMLLSGISVRFNMKFKDAYRFLESEGEIVVISGKALFRFPVKWVEWMGLDQEDWECEEEEYV